MNDIQPNGDNLLDQMSRKILPALYSQEAKGIDAIAYFKFFTPDSSWDWFVCEFDGDDLLYGVVIGAEIRFDYFSLSELQSVKGPLGLPIERDLYFKPKSLKDLIEDHQRERK